LGQDYIDASEIAVLSHLIFSTSSYDKKPCHLRNIFGIVGEVGPIIEKKCIIYISDISDEYYKEKKIAIDTKLVSYKRWYKYI